MITDQASNRAESRFASCLRLKNDHVHVLAIEADDGKTYCLATALLRDVVVDAAPPLTQKDSRPVRIAPSYASPNGR